METKQINDKLKHIYSLLKAHRLREALHALSDTAAEARDWQVISDTRLIDEDYRRLTDLVAAGTQDPSRIDMYHSLIERTYITANRLQRRLLAPFRPTLYYNTLTTSDKQLEDYLDELTNTGSGSSSFFEQITSGDTDTTLPGTPVSRELFYAIWTAFPLDDTSRVALSDHLLSLPPAEAAPLLSALLLGQLEFHDPRRLSIMADIYARSDDTSLRAQSLLYLLISLYKYHYRHLDVSLTEQLKTLTELPGWQKDLSTAFIELLRTRDTERISRKMSDEIIPAMINLRPEIMKKFGEIDPESLDLSNPEALEANPEWEQILKDSGIEDKLKQMNEIQMDGGDVFMSTFSHLKRFPFFHDPIGWFTLFEPTDEAVDRAVDGNMSLAETLANVPMLCDSDKFSLAFSMKMIPEDQRQMMFSQFEAQRLNLYQANMALGTDNFKARCSRHLQNLNRFLKLFRRKGEFYDPFIEDINLSAVPVINASLDKNTLTVAGEFLFKIELWHEAADIFASLPSSDTLSQKIGYCHEKLADYDSAYNHYRQAETQSVPSRWLLRRLTAMARRLGLKEDSLRYAHALVDLDPNDMEATMTLAYTLLENGESDRAITTLHRAEFIDENSSRPWRALAWALFLKRDFTHADRYYQLIVRQDNPSPNDLFNYGHLFLAMDNLDRAVEMYRRSLSDSNDSSDFASRINADINDLTRAGVNPDIIPIIIDTVTQ